MRRRLLLAGPAVAAAVAAGVLLVGGGTSPPLRSAPPVDVGVVPAGTPAASGPAGPADPRLASVVAVAPVSLDIPSLGVHASVAPVGLAGDGALGVPTDPGVVGWWSGGPRPGATAGTAVLDSHVNYRGTPGAFAGLESLVPGASIDVDGASVRDRFVVTGVREYPKNSLPWATVFAFAVQGRLALVTCGGPFDPSTGHYQDNIVAFAVAAPS